MYYNGVSLRYQTRKAVTKNITYSSKGTTNILGLHLIPDGDDDDDHNYPPPPKSIHWMMMVWNDNLKVMDYNLPLTDTLYKESRIQRQ